MVACRLPGVVLVYTNKAQVIREYTAYRAVGTPVVLRSPDQPLFMYQFISYLPSLFFFCRTPEPLPLGASGNRSVRICETKTSGLLENEGSRAPRECGPGALAFSTNGRLVTSVYGDSTVVIWSRVVEQHQWCRDCVVGRVQRLLFHCSGVGRMGEGMGPRSGSNKMVGLFNGLFSDCSPCMIILRP